MGLKMKFVTEKPDDLELALQKLEEKLIVMGRGQVSSMYHKIDDHTFMVIISYPAANWISNRIVKQQFISTLKKMDKNIKIEIMK